MQVIAGTCSFIVRPTVGSHADTLAMLYYYGQLCKSEYSKECSTEHFLKHMMFRGGRFRRSNAVWEGSATHLVVPPHHHNTFSLSNTPAL